MATHNDVRCIQCNERSGLSQTNGTAGECDIEDIIAHRSTLEELGAWQKELNSTPSFSLDYGRIEIDCLWMLKHKGHALRPVAEYDEGWYPKVLIERVPPGEWPLVVSVNTGPWTEVKGGGK
jgi:hypothetical protein